MQKETFSRKSTLFSEPSHLWLTALLGFIACYILIGTVLQLRSKIPPWVDGAPLEFFTGGFLWMTSLLCLLISHRHSSSPWRLLFWLMGCAALSGLAIDEIFAFHEKSEIEGLFDDDYPKIVLWLATPGVFFLIFRMEHPSPFAKCAACLGYLFHSLYMLVELGDGEFFRIPFGSRETLRWFEEFFELFFLASYFFSFVLIHMSQYGERVQSAGSES